MQEVEVQIVRPEQILDMANMTRRGVEDPIPIASACACFEYRTLGNKCLSKAVLAAEGLGTPTIAIY